MAILRQCRCLDGQFHVCFGAVNDYYFIFFFLYIFFFFLHYYYIYLVSQTVAIFVKSHNAQNARDNTYFCTDAFLDSLIKFHTRIVVTYHCIDRSLVLRLRSYLEQSRTEMNFVVATPNNVSTAAPKAPKITCITILRTFPSNLAPSL